MMNVIEDAFNSLNTYGLLSLDQYNDALFQTIFTVVKKRGRILRKNTIKRKKRQKTIEDIVEKKQEILAEEGRVIDEEESKRILEAAE